ncbi:uncharacterized protein L969DRAFT_55179 [Mixia osmundae IAM 14324]|uniref:Uncharacterized protein n=1 Tax=Mixia osmundae (strain CBS 9802 / IAM 14324 / JCM 22182 / KY 12970) TaxID=764103 RepID=G7DVG5_MIXOS|nr:uncharacterized protein L969DRAFT_55179 [Mixia osmundae IAM 14324]KEI36371.1 hypothetical protein L969DRAFT_55179 [Mixia osmundae IAM 14324]GAA94575.1 hypothetical protein E5Q_01227 [Mixia osmundae IAM 14324]
MTAELPIAGLFGVQQAFGALALLSLVVILRQAHNAQPVHAQDSGSSAIDRSSQDALRKLIYVRAVGSLGLCLFVWLAGMLDGLVRMGAVPSTNRISTDVASSILGPLALLAYAMSAGATTELATRPPMLMLRRIIFLSLVLCLCVCLIAAQVCSIALVHYHTNQDRLLAWYSNPAAHKALSNLTSVLLLLLCALTAAVVALVRGRIDLDCTISYHFDLIALGTLMTATAAALSLLKPTFAIILTLRLMWLGSASAAIADCIYLSSLIKKDALVVLPLHDPFASDTVTYREATMSPVEPVSIRNSLLRQKLASLYLEASQTAIQAARDSLSATPPSLLGRLSIDQSSFADLFARGPSPAVQRFSGYSIGLVTRRQSAQAPQLTQESDHRSRQVARSSGASADMLGSPQSDQIQQAIDFCTSWSVAKTEKPSHCPSFTSTISAAAIESPAESDITGRAV